MTADEAFALGYAEGLTRPLSQEGADACAAWRARWAEYLAPAEQQAA
jgi:hypothetical protein